MTNRWLFALILIAIGVTVAACGPTRVGDEPAADQTIEPAGQGSELALIGADWVLDSYLGPDGKTMTALAGGRVTARFEENEVGGTAGCNHYGGPAVIDGDRLAIGPLASTLMACLEPEGIMEQEMAFLTNLELAVSYNFEGQQLVLKNGAGQELLRFDQAEPAELTGSAWLVAGFSDGRGGLVSVLPETEGQLTAEFGEDGLVTGSAGCNSYSANYTVENGTLTIGPAVSTKMFCEQPDGVMGQETAFLAALSLARSYLIDGDRLELHSAEGELLISLTGQ